MNFLWLLSCCALWGTAFSENTWAGRGQKAVSPSTHCWKVLAQQPQISKGQRGPCSQFSHALLVLV